MGNSVKTIRAVIPIFSTIYPVIFKLLYVICAYSRIHLMYRAMTRPSEQIYTNFMSARERIIGFVINPSAQPQNVGIKAAAWKFVQKVLIAGTRGASADPRVCQRIRRSDQTRRCADATASSERKDGRRKYQYDHCGQSSQLQPAR